MFRKRTAEDEPIEFMPLSKRINNLHLNNSNSNLNFQLNSQNLNNNLNITNGQDSSSSNSQFSEEGSTEGYNPELNHDENPFYYNKNKLLYDLYIERMRRGE